MNIPMDLVNIITTFIQEIHQAEHTKLMKSTFNNILNMWSYYETQNYVEMLCQAAYHGNMFALKYMIELGALDVDPVSTLYYACDEASEAGNYDIVNFLYSLIMDSRLR